MKFEILPAEYDDLDPADPLRPAVIVHAVGRNSERCYTEVSRQYSTYVVGRGPLPPLVGVGYFFTAAHLDYPTLRTALRPYWPDAPAHPPTGKHDDVLRLISTQEFADVLNYTSRTPQPDARIFTEARTRMPQVMSRSLQAPFARVCRWLRRHMLPADNCYTLAALLARWLQAQDVPAEYCTGELTFRTAGREATIPHAWVEVAGDVLDLTVDKQRGWGDDRLLRKMARIGVRDHRLVYRRNSDSDASDALERLWCCYSKPEERFGYTYTPASQERQAAMIREQLQALPAQPRLRRERAAWTALVVQYGILEGTFRLLEMVARKQAVEVDGAERYQGIYAKR